MALLTKKIPASTLIESLIAMVIILSSFGIATTLYVNVITSGNQLQKLSTQFILKEIAIETKQKHLFLDENLTRNGITIQKKVAPYNGTKNLLLLNLRALNENEKLISEYNEIVPNQ